MSRRDLKTDLEVLVAECERLRRERLHILTRLVAAERRAGIERLSLSLLRAFDLGGRSYGFRWRHVSALWRQRRAELEDMPEPFQLGAGRRDGRP